MNLEAESAIDVATLFIGSKITKEGRILRCSIQIALAHRWQARVREPGSRCDRCCSGPGEHFANRRQRQWLGRRYPYRQEA